MVQKIHVGLDITNSSSSAEDELSAKVSRKDLSVLGRMLAAPLRLALRRGDLSVQYQAQWNLHTGELVGLEALARWQHRQLGSIPPSVFIPVAESDELICLLGTRLLHQVFGDINFWDAAGLGIPRVALNISPRQLQSGFADYVLSSARRANLEPARIQFEITESIEISENGSCIHALIDLHNAGFSLAIDDFGVGYSNLNALRYLPIQVIKVDRRFLVVDPPRRIEREILRSIISLSDRLGLETIAEGVECASQVSLLREIGCSQAQGYYLSRPVSRAEIAAANVSI